MATADQQQRVRTDEQHSVTEGDRQETALTTVNGGNKAKSEYLSLRTVPVILKNGHRSITVNALLDDASTRSYINSDVAAELGLQGQQQIITVSGLNERLTTFETKTVNFMLKSLDGKTSTTLTAYTANKVTGDMQVVDWSKHAHKWPHLKNIHFPTVSSKPIIDLLIGLDFADLHYSMQDVRGGQGEPMARCTPLGWTCIGNSENVNQSSSYSSVLHTYFINEKSCLESISSTLERFWEIENVKEQKTQLTTEEKDALDKVEKSFSFTEGRYEVGIPWKSEAPQLPDNYTSAYQRLKQVENKLKKIEEVASSYSKIIDEYMKKGYIRKVENQERNETGWYLPHFPVVKQDRTTTKVRIVFDAAAKCHNVSTKVSE